MFSVFIPILATPFRTTKAPICLPGRVLEFTWPRRERRHHPRRARRPGRLSARRHTLTETAVTVVRKRADHRRHERRRDANGSISATGRSSSRRGHGDAGKEPVPRETASSSCISRL
jgi:hypothetical protein